MPNKLAQYLLTIRYTLTTWHHLTSPLTFNDITLTFKESTMRLAIGDSIRVKIFQFDENQQPIMIPHTTDQSFVSIPATVSKFEVDTTGELYLTAKFPSGKEGIPMNKAQVGERVAEFQLQLAPQTEYEY